MEGRFQKSLSVSWKEGIPASVMVSLLDYYLVPFGLFLGATTQAIAWLVSLPHLLSSMAQPMAVAGVRWMRSRLRFIVAEAAAQAALLLPVAVLAFLPAPGKVGFLIALVIGFRVLASWVGTAWGSLVSEYLPGTQRGAYFGWRSQVVGVAGLAGVALGGILLAAFKDFSPALGFFLLFSTAAGLRFVSAALLAKLEDLPVSSPPGSEFTFWMFLRRFRESNFVRFVLFVSGITFATHLAAPYFSVYMLRDLRLSYLSYMVIHLSAALAALVAVPIWGRHADWVGNARVLKATSLAVPVIPFLWLVSASVPYLVVVELAAGFIWAGFNLCATNFIYDAVSPEKRVRCLGYYNLINGTAVFAGALLGGFLADRLPTLGASPLLTLFVISGLLRLGSRFFLSPQFHEVRESARDVSSLQLFFSVAGIRPMAGPSSEVNVFPWSRRAFR